MVEEKDSNQASEEDASERLAKNKFQVHYQKDPTKSLLFRFFQVFLGSVIYVLSIRLFVDHAGLLPSGITGLSKLIQRIVLTRFKLEIPFAIFNITFNIIPALYAFFNVGRNFVWLSIASSMTTSFLMDIIPVFHLTDDLFLAAIIAGVIQGFGLIIIMNADASGGGTGFIAMAISNKYNKSVWNYVMIFNIAILSFSAFFFSLEAALYSIVFQFISTQVLNHGHLRYQRKTCFIVVDQVQPIADDLMTLTRHGITVMDVTGCYTSNEQYLLYMVVSRTDVRKIRQYLREHAPEAFLNVTDSEQLSGNFFVDPID
ncbi:MAG TPA: YitT family protein [Candidatus Eisenbacteria bacterium]|nr:YitT family protein [Candidatus Eisenbacteria bacterium]